MKRLLTLAVFALAVPIGAQTCTLSPCTAASVNETDFLAALPAPGATGAFVVNIPTGTASWTSAIGYSVPSGVTSLTIQGNTTVNCTGTAGTSSYACSAVDNTIIQQSYNTFGATLSIVTNSSSSSLLRITGITWESGASTIGQEPVISLSGNGQIRWDHTHILNTTGNAIANVWVRNYGNTTGVVDHNLFDMSTCNGFGSSCPAFNSSPWGAFNDYNDTSGGLGDGTFANPTAWGSSHAIFLENNYQNGGAGIDCYIAGYYVMRYNTINDSYIPIQTHGTKSPGGPVRSCRAYEAYNNYITGPGGSQTTDAVAGSKGTTALLWGNTMASGTAYRFTAFATDRNGGDSAPETNPPNGWGYCGTTVTNPSTGNPNGVGSNWDGNQPTIATGYPCLDGVGRGQQTQGMNNQAFPNRLNTATSTIAWPQQYLEPVYMWNNTINGATYLNIRDLTTQNNRDIYYDQTAQSGSFTGAAGTGFGLLSARPSTCTAGAGGTYQTSPTGSYGVAYFATDANSGNGELYVCTATNIWTGIYQPYTYPHPLAGGSAGVSLTVSTSGLGGVTGTNCTSGSYTSGTTIGPCTANTSGGSTFSGWTGVSGSAACSGTTNPCPSFTLTATTAFTASFTGGGGTAATPVWAPGSGTYPYNTNGTLSTTTTGCGTYIYWGSTNPPTTANYNVQNFVITVAGTYYAKVIGCPGYSDSAVSSVTYTISSPSYPTALTGHIQLSGQVKLP